MRHLWPYIIAAAVIFVITVIIGLLVNPELSSNTMEELKETLAPLASLGPVALLIVIIINNTIKALFSIILGIIVGLPSLVFIGFNGFTIGVLVSALQAEIGFIPIIASLAPHGIIEIPALILSTSLGFVVGMEVIKFIARKRSQVKATLKQSLILYARWILPGLIVAAIIEVFITPLTISLFIK
ncbi:stage II sporulation protein M [Chloroflexota bacterium]